MDIYKWKKKNIIPKNAKFLSLFSPELDFGAKYRHIFKDAVIYAQKICPDVLLDEYKKTAELSPINTMDLFTWMVLDSVKLRFEKQTTFGCLGDISLNKKALIGTTIQTHNQAFSVFRYKSREYSFSGVGESICSLRFGVNDNGLFVSQHRIYSNEDGQGITPGLTMRLILERCSSIKGVISLLESIPHSICYSFFVSHKNQLAIIEISPKLIKIIEPQKYMLSLTNHFISEELVNFDIKNNLFPQNTSIQRDAHAVFMLLKDRHKLNINIFKNILHNRTGDIASDEGDFTTKYTAIYEQNSSYFILADGCSDKHSFKKIRI